MTTESAYVQLSADGVGKKIQNALVRSVLQSDGTYSDVYLQCVTLVNKSGVPIDVGEIVGLLTAALKEIQALREMYGAATGLSHMALNSRNDEII